MQGTAAITRPDKEHLTIWNHRSYHFKINGEEAEKRLKLCDEDRFLTRYSENWECYVLSVYKKEPKPSPPTIKHFRLLIKDNDTVNIDGKEKEFENLKKLLHYYRRNPIDESIRSIGREYAPQQYEKKRVCREEKSKEKKC